MYESKDKMVSHPDHYQSSKGIEVIDCIEAFTEGLDGIEATDTGNIIKYACRWKKKNGIQDLEKILWYTQHLIDYLKNKGSEKVSSDTRYDTVDISVISELITCMALRGATEEELIKAIKHSMLLIELYKLTKQSESENDIDTLVKKYITGRKN